MKKIIIGLFLFLGGCSDVLEKNHSPREEFEKLTQPIHAPRPSQIFKKVPEVPLKLLKPLSIDVDEHIPLKDIYIDLCKQANVGCEISNNFKDTRIHFSAHEQAFIEILEDLGALTNKKITRLKNRIRIEDDYPHLVNYNIQFLTGQRKTQNKISTATQVLSGSQNEKNMLDNGSSSVISTNNNIDFWQELESTIQTIMTYIPSNFSSDLRENSEDDEDLDPKKEKTKFIQKYAFHKQAGLLSIVGTSMQHKAISNYLQELRKAATAQVLIEAKLIEVTLSKEFQSGINWELMLSKTTDSSLNKMLSNGNPFLVNYKNGDLTGALSLIEKFGTTKTLSNPRLTVMNNQNAVLKIGENRVFFRLKYNQVYLDPLRKSDREGSGIITANSEIQTVPIGITLSVQPSINLDTGDITLSIRPTITNSHKNIADPAVQITSKDHNIKSEIPIIEVRELDSVLTMKSGNIAIIGGLMQEKSKDQTAGIPGTSGSFFEGLFGNSEYERTLTELVVFLKATILENPEPDAKDIQVYENSIHDNRPWRTK